MTEQPQGENNGAEPKEETPEEIHQEFVATMNDLAGTHSLAIAGLAILNDNLAAIAPPNLTDESLFLFGSEMSEDDQPTFAYQAWRYKQLPEKTDPDGPVFLNLGRQWLVTVVTEWNENFRPRFAEAEGVELNEIADQCMGDLNLFRNDIIHHRGIASSGNSGRAQNRWFQVGDEIRIFPEHVAEVMAYFGITEAYQDVVDDGPWTPYHVDLSEPSDE